MAARVRKRWLWAALVLTLLATGPFLIWRADRSFEADLDALAKMGVPRDADEFMQDLGGSAETANKYRELGKKLRELPDSTSLDKFCLWKPGFAKGELERLHNELHPIVALSMDAAASPYPDFEWDWNEGGTLLTSEAFALRQGAKLLAGESRYQTVRGDFGKARAALQAIDQTAAQISRMPVETVLASSGLSIGTLYWTAAMDLLKFAKDDVESLEQLQVAFDNRALFPSLRKSLAGEFVLSRATMELASRNPEILRAGYSQEREPPTELDIKMYGVLREETERKFVKRFRKLFVSLPADEKEVGAIGVALNELEETITSDNSPSGRLNHLLWPDLKDFALDWKRSLAQRRHLQVAVRLLCERLDRGTLPSTLPDYGEVSIDPFSMKPFRYQKVHNGFVLYSVGPDGIDNGADKERWSVRIDWTAVPQ